MLLCIPGVLDAARVADFRRRLDAAEWIDGNATSGAQAALAKNNTQVREGSPVAAALGEAVLDALAASPLFISAALPLKIFPALFNRYAGGQAFATHVDNAIRAVPGTIARVRTDLSATIFLSEPDDYDGGELVVESGFGAQTIKLPAGDMALYPSTSLHHVTPVTRGARVASFFWLQSMVRDESRRTILFDLDQSIQQLAGDRGLDDPVAVRLTGVYHNLLRQWADT